MTDAVAPRAEDFAPGRPVVFRNATAVITVDSAGVLENADVLIVDNTIAGVGHNLVVPAGTLEIDAKGGIVMPGMIDTHRHMWQTALRGYGGDWALSQYFVFYYLTWGHVFRAEDIAAGNQLSALESVDQGVTTTVDWSHALRTTEYADAAVEALKSIPGRYVLAYGNYLGAPWEWMNEPGFQNWVKNFKADDMMGLQVAFDVNSGPDFHEKGAFQAARELGLRVTTHAGVWGVNGDPNIEYMYDNGFMDETVTYVHASSLGADSYHKIAATGGTISISTESEQSAGQGYPSAWVAKKYGITASLSMDTSVWWSADFFSAMRSTLSSFRSRDHLEAHNKGETVNVNRMKAEEAVWQATMGGAHSIGMADKLGSITVGKKADIVLLKNDESPDMTPILNPYAHVVYQAGTADVHTVVVNGKVVKYDGKRIGLPLKPVADRVAASVEYVRGELGEDAWAEWMNPALPEDEPIANPYKYLGEDDGHKH